MALPFVDRSSSSLPVQIVGQSSWRKWLKEQSAARRGWLEFDGRHRQGGRSRRVAGPRRQGCRCSACAVGQAHSLGLRRARHPAAGRHLAARVRHRTGVADRRRRRHRARHLALRTLSDEQGQGGREDRLAAGRRQGARHGDDRGDLDGARSHHHAVVRHGTGRARGRGAGSRQDAQGQDQGDRGRRSSEAELSRWCTPSAAPARARRA